MNDLMNKAEEFRCSEGGKVFFYVLMGFVLGILVGTFIGRASRCKNLAILSNNGCDNEFKNNFGGHGGGQGKKKK